MYVTSSLNLAQSNCYISLAAAGIVIVVISITILCLISVQQSFMEHDPCEAQGYLKNPDSH